MKLKQKSVKVKKLRTDNGGEFISDSFKKWIEEKGIMASYTPVNTPQRNGVAERMNRTLLDRETTTFTKHQPFIDTRCLWDTSLKFCR